MSPKTRNSARRWRRNFISQCQGRYRITRTDIEMRDIMKNEADYKRLLEVGGMDQVPCLFIDGKPMYESLDIIDWLEKHPQDI